MSFACGDRCAFFCQRVLQVIDLMLQDPVLGKLMVHPSVTYGATQLYSRGVFEADTKPNLEKPIAQLLGGGETTALLTVNDKKLSAPLRVRLRLR
jgi:ubiquitin-activating enzyme E1 C